METRSETIRARVKPSLKKNAEKIFEKLGLSATDAISMFYRQVVLNKGLPFEVKIPNAETRKAIEETMRGEGLLPSSLDDLRKMFK